MKQKDSDDDSWLLDIPIRGSDRGVQVLVKKADKLFVLIANTIRSRGTWFLNTGIKLTKLSFELDDTIEDLCNAVVPDVKKRCGLE